jgi:hypothetical protein
VRKQETNPPLCHRATPTTPGNSVLRPAPALKMKRHRLMLLLIIVLPACILALYLHHNREPRYEGRTLTQWLEDIDHTATFHSPTDKFPAARSHAIKQIGTNAIPFLLKKLAARDTAFEKSMKSLLARQSLIHIHFTPPLYDPTHGLLGLQILGKDADSAAPALALLTQSPDQTTRLLALHSLYLIKADKEAFLPVLLRLLHDQDSVVRGKSAERLNEIYPEEAEKAGVYTNFPNLKPTTTNTVPTNAPEVR